MHWTNRPTSVIVEAELLMGGTAMTVTVDSTRCIGCGMCAYAAPEVFRIVGKVSAVIAQPEGRNSRVSDAANGCPVNAIRISL